MLCSHPSISRISYFHMLTLRLQNTKQKNRFGILSSWSGDVGFEFG